MTIRIPAEAAMALALAFSDNRCPPQIRRETAERVVDELIDYLDALDGDADLEPDGTEEDQSFPEYGGLGVYLHEDDEDVGDTEPDADDEPTLGSPEINMGTYAYEGPNGWQFLATGSQEGWAKGDNSIGADDCEFVNEDGGDILDEPHDCERTDDEPEADDEPSLGWSDNVNQTILRGGVGPEDVPASGDWKANAAARREAKSMLRGVVLREGETERVVLIRSGLPTLCNVVHLNGEPVRFLRDVGSKR